MPAPSESIWKWPDKAALQPASAPAEAHVWLAFVGDEDPGVLSPEENARARRFRFEKDRRAYVFHHATLRRILALYLKLDPAAVAFVQGGRGKPALAPPHDAWQFNMAHSDEAGLYAVCRGSDLGVDIEAVRPIPDAGRIAARFFTPAERAALDGYPESFFRTWVRKEALIKATGEGMAALESSPLVGWSVLDLPDVPGYEAALAFAGGPPLVRTWRWCYPQG